MSHSDRAVQAVALSLTPAASREEERRILLADIALSLAAIADSLESVELRSKADPGGPRMIPR